MLKRTRTLRYKQRGQQQTARPQHNRADVLHVCLRIKPEFSIYSIETSLHLHRLC
jgi:hypothetical protein